MNTRTVQPNKRELTALFAAMKQLNNAGQITENCPRCGKPIIFETRGSKYISRCSDKNCIRIVGRGI
jgi:hypothetical protein